MELKYPELTCPSCAIDALGVPKGCVELQLGICEVCNSKKYVCPPSFYGYPAFKNLSCKTAQLPM
jgi:hypothetical protein